MSAPDDLAQLWSAAQESAPPGWVVQGLRCASTGLATVQRSDRWVAEACGPAEGCVVVTEETPERALSRLIGALSQPD